MFGISIDNPDVPCPECRRILVEVRGLSRALGLDVGVTDGGSVPVMSFGFGYGRAGQGAIFLLELFNALIDGVLGWFHKRKARKLCEKLLKEAPNSLICANCLFVYRRPSTPRKP